MYAKPLVHSLADGESYARALESAAAWCIRRSRLTFAIALALLIAAGLLATRVRFDPSPEAYLVGTDEWTYFEEVDRAYEIGETLVIAFREVGGTVFDVESLTAVAELDRVLSAMPGIDRVLSLATATQLSRTEGDSLDLTPLLVGGITPQSALDLGQRIQKHPVYNQLLVDPHHESTFLFVQLSSREASPEQRLDSVRNIRAELERFRSKHRIVHLAGSAVTKEAIASGVEHDAQLFFPAAMILLIVLLWFMFSDFMASLIPLFLVGFASLLVFGLQGLLGIPINLATASAPTMVMVVGLGDSVHFLTEYRRHYARIGDREEAILSTVGALALPSLLSSASAALAFLALLISRVEPLREFGIAAAAGIVFSYFASMLLLPVLLLRFNYPRARSVLFPAAPRLGRAASRFAVYAHRHLLATLAITGLASGICVAAVNRIGIDSDFVSYLSPDHRLRSDIAVIESTLGGADVIEVILESKEPGYFKTGKGLRLLDQLSNKLEGVEGVSRTFCLTHYMRLANAVMTGVEPTRTSPLPETEQAVAQLALLDPTAFSALTSEDMTQTRLTLQIRSYSTDEVLRLTASAQAVADKILAGSPVTITFTGLPILFARIVRNLVVDATRSFGLATFVLFLAMLVGLRSWTTALAAMIPNVLTVVVTFATMAALGMSFDTDSPFVISLGIAVTVVASVHVSTRFTRARREGSPSPAAAIQYAVTHSGHPVVLGSVLLVVCFSVLLLSSFQPSFRTGLLSVILVLYALLLDLFLLPVLLILADALERRFDRPTDDRESRRIKRTMTQLLSQAPTQSTPSKGSSANDKLADPTKYLPL
jgi:uncharacterized protein